MPPPPPPGHFGLEKMTFTNLQLLKEGRLLRKPGFREAVEQPQVILSIEAALEWVGDPRRFLGAP